MIQIRRSFLLGVGFAALLLVIAISAVSIARNTRNAQARVAALHEAHTRAATALSAIRSNAYLIGILTRDYLLEEDPAQARGYFGQLNDIRRNTEQEFATLQSSGQDAEERAALKKLLAEFEAYWDPTEIVLDWTPAEKRAQRVVVLRERVRRREEVIALASQVEQLLTSNFQRERERITWADQEFRSSLGVTSGVALLLSLGIAFITLARLRALEIQSVRAESELRHLSGQLRTAQEQERRHLSRELHDQVGQMLTALRMELAAIARQHGDAESGVSERIARAKGTVEHTLRIVRNIAMMLRPSMLDDLGLVPALAWLVKEMSRSSELEIRSTIDPALDELPDSHRTCLYRMIQEALTNTTKHSGGNLIDVTLQCDAQWVTGVISDNGRGFNRASGQQKGLGLVGMEERAKELGGSLRIESTPGRGTRIEIRLPRPALLEGTDDQDSHRRRPRDRTDRIETAV